MTISQNNPNAVLALAQYAYTRVAPLFAQAKTIDPSIHFEISMVFADQESWIHHECHVKVWAHWSGPGMFQHSDWLQTMEDVDAYAAALADDVAALQAPEAVTA